VERARPSARVGIGLATALPSCAGGGAGGSAGLPASAWSWPCAGAPPEGSEKLFCFNYLFCSRPPLLFSFAPGAGRCWQDVGSLGRPCQRRRGRQEEAGGGQVVLKVVCVLKAGGKVQASPFGRRKAEFRSSNTRFPFLASFRRRQRLLSSSSPCL